jgi:hypothetical protein
MGDDLRAKRAIGKTLDVIQERTRERDELRAILAPLLDHPYQHIARLGWCCTFCAQLEGRPHADTCAVRRRDILLGRT